MPVEFMKDAYGMLYQIENMLRLKIDFIMEERYGRDWIRRAPLENKYEPYKKDDLNDFHLYELIKIINSYECIKDQIDIPLRQTSRIPYIRNKIAHSKLISDGEYDLLKSVYSKLLEIDFFVE